MSKKLRLIIVIVSISISVFSALSFIQIRANKDLKVMADNYDEDRAIKLPDSAEDIKRREKALKELAEEIKRQEEGPADRDEENAYEQYGRTKKIKGEKLNLEELSSFDNKRHSWWIGLNKGHMPTTVPEYAKKLISDYDGIYLGDILKKKIYITFDEGYENGYTSKILDVLKANNVKSVFFVTGPYIKENYGLVKRMLDEGHLVGNHTINHPSLPSVSLVKLENELFGLERQFYQAFGTGFKYMRPPRGEYSERVLAASKKLGYKTVFWSFAYMDFDVKGQKGGAMHIKR